MTKNLSIDVMIHGGDKFYCTLLYPFSGLFKLELEDVFKFVYDKRPTLKYRKDVVLVIDKGRRQR